MLQPFAVGGYRPPIAQCLADKVKGILALIGSRVCSHLSKSSFGCLSFWACMCSAITLSAHAWHSTLSRLYLGPPTTGLGQLAQVIVLPPRRPSTDWRAMTVFSSCS